MASLISFIGSIERDSERIPSGMVAWDGSKGFAENIVKYDTTTQFRCLLDQSIAIAYWMTFYGKRCSDLVSEYINEFNSDLEYRFLPLAKKEFKDGPFNLIISDLESILSYNKTRMWRRIVNVAGIREFLGSSDVYVTPTVWKENMFDAYVPFLIWMNKKIMSSEQETEFVSKRLGFLSFRLYRTSGYADNSMPKLCLNPWFYPIGTSFSTKKNPLDGKYPGIEILSYLSHFDLSGIAFETLLGNIGDMTFHYDVGRSGTTGTQMLAAALRSDVVGLSDISGGNACFTTAIDTMKPQLFTAMKEFLLFANKTYGMEPRDPDILAKTFCCLAGTKEQKDSAAYIRQQGGSASADNLESSKTLGGLEALQLISQTHALLSAQSQATEPTEKPEEKAEEKETEEPKKGEEAKPEEKGNDTPDDEGTDDTSDLDEGTEPDESSDEGDPSTSGEEAGASSTDMHEEANPEPETSDDNGIEFSIANPDDETVDSVMFREEMDTFLKNVLANPPEDLSPQQIAVLTKLRAYWLFTLRIESIMGIVGNCLKQLPKSLTKLASKCGVKNNE